MHSLGRDGSVMITNDGTHPPFPPCVGGTFRRSRAVHRRGEIGESCSETRAALHEHVINAGATILKSLSLDNAAAKILVDIAKSQDDEVGPPLSPLASPHALALVPRGHRVPGFCRAGPVSLG